MSERWTPEEKRQIALHGLCVNCREPRYNRITTLADGSLQMYLACACTE